MELLNTLYVTSENAYVHLDHDTVRVDVEKKTTLRVPLIHIEAIVCFGNVLVSPAMMHRCGDDGRALVFLSRTGRFKARLVGPTGGNVMLRRAQHEAVGDSTAVANIARRVVAGKVQNSRQVLLRAARESGVEVTEKRLRDGAQSLAGTLESLRAAGDVDRIRGCEGDAARVYFELFNDMIKPGLEAFHMQNRTRRPPRDALNALLSFLYAMVLSECVAALESVGLDPQVGYLHALRPGKPALALDLMEEFRPVMADRLALTLINRRQVGSRDFDLEAGGAVMLNDTGRKAVIGAYQKRKAETTRHLVLDRSVALGLVPHVQARLLARCLRGDIPTYPPFVMR